ncbi:MAG: hypothetical protein ACI87W_002082 [Halieaceae bacterium]|jgi:hypothetical protein
MAISRRALLRTGAASVLILGGSSVWLSTRSSAEARGPWRAASAGFGDPRLDALAYAILAPNPHNMQPWQIGLEGEDSFALFARSDRLLPETDPPCRQITIGFGCFLGLFRQAAAEKGCRTEISSFPDGEPQPMLDERPLARVRIVRDDSVAREPLFAATLQRHTQRAPFDTDQEVAAESLDRLCAVATPAVKVLCSAEASRRDMLRERYGAYME